MSNKYNLNIDGIEFSIIKDRNTWGDGEHETTKFIMNFICKYGVKDKSVIDIGTGTGILSVLCAKLGASNILALDINPFAIECAKKNFLENNVKVDIEMNELVDSIDNKVDVILSNLAFPEQMIAMQRVKKNMKPDSIVIMSWLNNRLFSPAEFGLEIVECVEGIEYDVYVLKLK